MPYYVMDQSTWPVVTVKFIDPATDDEFDAYLRSLEALYDRETPFALVFDARDAAYLPRQYRKRQAQWIDDNEAQIREYLAGTAYVIPSAVLRGVLRAIFALQDQPAEYVVTDTLEDAHAWAETQVSKVTPAEG
jgi:hypothetical protein